MSPAPDWTDKAPFQGANARSCRRSSQGRSPGRRCRRWVGHPWPRRRGRAVGGAGLAEEDEDDSIFFFSLACDSKLDSNNKTTYLQNCHCPLYLFSRTKNKKHLKSVFGFLFLKLIFCFLVFKIDVKKTLSKHFFLKKIENCF